MVSSTEMPNAMLNTKTVDGLMGMPNQPITPAVNSSGNRLGTKAMATILEDLNKLAIIRAITQMAKAMEMPRFLTMYVVPSKNVMLVPVMMRPYFSGGKMESTRGRTSSNNSRISRVPTSAIWTLTRVTARVESKKLPATPSAMADPSAASADPRSQGPNWVFSIPVRGSR